MSSLWHIQWTFTTRLRGNFSELTLAAVLIPLVQLEKTHTTSNKTYCEAKLNSNILTT